MTGGQYSSKSKQFSEGSILGNQKWKKLFSLNKETITPFLISKFSDTTKTKIHTCPFFGAKNGEMAVYALQHIYGKN